MNAMAAHQATAAQPQIVVVNDGKPVESVGREAKHLGLAKMIVPAVAALVLGVVVGQMGTKASIYNETIDDAAKIAAAVKQVDKSLQNLRNILYTAKERGPGGTKYLIADEELTKELEALELTMPELTKIYDSRLYEMEQGVVDQTMKFFADAAVLYDLIEEHARKAKSEAKALVAGKSRLEEFGLPTRYGVIVKIPKEDEGDKPVSASFVEIGDPICGDGKPHPEGCGGPPQGFMYRPAELGPWGKKDLATPEGNYIPSNRLIPLGFDPSPTLKALFKGGEATVSEVTYMTRITDIDAKVDDLLERAKALQKSLTSTASRGKQFTFFL